MRSELKRARHLTLLPLLLGALLLCSPGLVSAQDDDVVFPGGSGLERRPYRSPIFRVGAQRVQIELMRPDSWDANSDRDALTLLAEPSPNPGDLGLLAFLFDAAAPAEPFAGLTQADDGLLTFLGGFLEEPTESARDTLSLRDPSGGSFDATVITVDGRFRDGQPAKLFVLHAVHGDVGLVVMTGASDRAFNPYREELRAMIASITLNTAPTP